MIASGPDTSGRGSAFGPTVRQDASPWERYGWAMAAVWLGFLFYPVVSVVESDRPMALRVLALVAILAFAITYGFGFTSHADRHAWRVWGLLILLALLTIPATGTDMLGMTPYLAAYAALQLPPPGWPYAAAAATFAPAIDLVVPNDDFPDFFFTLVIPIAAGCAIIRVLSERHHEHEILAGELRMTEERDRVARDVHDVLGHSLTVLVLKAELAERLVDADPERAKAELAELREISREALAEVRSTVGGLRAGNLGRELANARDVLADAEVDVEVTGDVSDTDPRHRTLLAWVLRESVTNIVRHAHARHAVITLAPTGLTVADDGVGCTGTTTTGNGLRGMRERVEAAGGTLGVHGPEAPGRTGTRVEVRLR